eukprot:1393808-Pleurochrysis_carterae.AAC.1
MAYTWDIGGIRDVTNHFTGIRYVSHVSLRERRGLYDAGSIYSIGNSTFALGRYYGGRGAKLALYCADAMPARRYRQA